MPGTKSGQYILFFINAPAKRPSNQLHNCFHHKKAQIQFQHTFWLKNIAKHLQKKAPCLSSMVIILWFLDLASLSFPSTNSTLCITLLTPQDNESYSLPNGWGFCGQNNQPGHINIECQIDMVSSRHITQDGTNTSEVWSFHSSIICLTFQKQSWYWGGLALMKCDSCVFALNYLFDM